MRQYLVKISENKFWGPKLSIGPEKCGERAAFSQSSKNVESLSSTKTAVTVRRFHLKSVYKSQTQGTKLNCLKILTVQIYKNLAVRGGLVG